MFFSVSSIQVDEIVYLEEHGIDNNTYFSQAFNLSHGNVIFHGPDQVHDYDCGTECR